MAPRAPRACEKCGEWLIPEHKRKELKKMKHVVSFCGKILSGEHEDHADCWCCPEVEIFENGNKLVIHNDVN